MNRLSSLVRPNFVQHVSLLTRISPPILNPAARRLTMVLSSAPRHANITTTAASASSSSSSSALKRPAESGAAQPNKAPRKAQFSTYDYKKQKETEMQDLESGMESYDWQKPSFPVSDSGPRIKYINSGADSSLDSLLAELLERPSDADPEDPIVLGFDMEWKFDFRGGAVGRTALIQICSRSLVLILHITHMIPETDDSDPMPTFPQALEDILRRPDVLLTGVRIEGDAKKLQGEFRQRDQDATSSTAQTRQVASGSGSGAVTGIASEGLLELSILARRIDPERWGPHGKRLISLRELTAVYLGRKLIKDGARTSDWSQRHLTKEQIKYAASDVMVGLEVYEAIRRRAILKSQGATEGLEPLRRKRTQDVVDSDERAAGLKAVLNAKNKSSASSGSQRLGVEGSQGSSAASGSARKGNDSYISISEFAELEAMESQGGQFADLGQSESQMSISDDPILAEESQVDDNEPLESQMSTTEDTPATIPTDFFEAIRLATSHLSQQAVSATPRPRSPVKSSTKVKSPAKAKGTLPSSGPKPLLAHQRAFDLWVSEASPEEKHTFRTVSQTNNVQLATAAGYVLKAFIEGRHAPDATGTSAGFAAIPANLKKRLSEELSDPELKSVFFRYKWWLDKHNIVAIPPP
ncbi:unnamed protein product [Tilletia controversa]|nr:unnamed protein product [Tilletia controversa]